ncbi:S53 family peptidase [Amycolatopsis sp. NPDC003676]
MRKKLIAGGAFAVALALTTGGTATAQQFSAAPAATGGPTVKNACAQVRAAGHMSCFAQVRTDIKQARRAPGAAPSGYGPAELQAAYQLKADGGAGQTIAVTESGDYPSLKADLAAYRKQFGLPAGDVQIVNEDGQESPLPAADPDWAVETALDVDMIAATAPNAKILVVEAKQANTDDLGKAVDTAVKLGAKFVSNSWGGDESEGGAGDTHFNHPGVAITASSGDNGYGASWPASSPYAVGVGGTTLKNSGGSYTETAWKGAGSGCSSYAAKPAYQTAATGCDKKAIADVSAVADPATGVAVYDTFQQSGWQVVGGTSASSPIIASVYADAGTPGAQDWPAQYPWSHTDQLTDVTSGSNGSCDTKQWCNAGTGWDGPTGLGTPKGTAAFTK